MYTVEKELFKKVALTLLTIEIWRITAPEIVTFDMIIWEIGGVGQRE